MNELGSSPVDGTVHPAAPLRRREPYITQAGRDLRLDLIRGLCVVIMVIDHVAGESPLYLITGGNRFLTSAAEGFILRSRQRITSRSVVVRQLPDRVRLAYTEHCREL